MEPIAQVFLVIFLVTLVSVVLMQILGRKVPTFDLKVMDWFLRIGAPVCTISCIMMIISLIFNW